MDHKSYTRAIGDAQAQDAFETKGPIPAFGLRTVPDPLRNAGSGPARACVSQRVRADPAAG
jgi:hypothetical protein